MLVANISQFKKVLKSYIDRVTEDHDTLIVNGNGKTVVVMSLKDYNKMDAADYLLSTAANKEKMNRALTQSAEGNFIEKTMDELELMAYKKH